MNNRDNTIVLSAYFCGTGFNLDGDGLAAILNRFDVGTEIREPNNLNNKPLKDSYNMSFNGCGIEYGILGHLFGYGIDKQCQKVVTAVKKIRALLTEQKSGKRIIVNAYGHSRGGIACLMLAKMLGHYPLDMVEVNIAMLDPVPGNLITSAEMDIFKQTLANQVVDLSMCSNLKSVICLYVYEAMPGITFLAPIIPTYPKHTIVEEDIVLGNHTGVEELAVTQNNHPQGYAYPYAAPRFIAFMKNCGTKYASALDELSITCPNNYNTQVRRKLNPQLNLSHYENLIKNNAAELLPPSGKIITRDCHAKTQYAQLKFTSPKEGEFVNRYHRSLVDKNYQLAKPEEIMPIVKPDIKTLQLLQMLTLQVQMSMTVESKTSKKGELFTALIKQLNNVTSNDNEQDIESLIQTYLRLLINISLQRERYDCSLFSLSFYSTTTSGEKLKELLAEPKYEYFAQLIKGTSDSKPRYRDLRGYAGYDETQFTEMLRDSNFEKIESELSGMVKENKITKEMI